VMTVQEAGLPVTITTTVTDDVQVMDVAIHYRTAGQENYKIAPMVETATKSLYSGTLPANQVVPTGIEYYIKAMDNSGNMTTYPSVNPDKIPLSFRVADSLPPDVTYDPSKLTKVVITDPIIVTIEVTDRTGIKEVNVFYKLEGEKDFTLLPCRDLGNNRYSVTLPSPLATGNVYYYIQTEDNSGNKITSPKTDPSKQPYIVYVYDPFPPSSPTRLTAIPSPGGKVKLTWEKSTSNDVFRYNIYTDNGSGKVNYAKVFDFVDASRNSWDSSSLGEGVYRFSVRAIDRSGNEETNTVIVIAEADSVKPDRPTEVTATAISGGRIELTWKLSLSRDSTVYNIYWDNSQASIDYSSSIARVNDPGTKWTSDKLKDSIIYRFVVRCQDKAGNEDENTSVVSARADATPPSAVANLRSTTHKIDTWSNQSRITVNWSPSEDVISGLAGYSISWDVSEKSLPDEIVDIKDPTTTQLTYDSTDLLKSGSARIYFHIRPVDKAGNWNSDASHLGAILIDIQTPQPPNNLTSAPQPGGKIMLSWKASESNDVTKYNVYWDSGTGSVDYAKTIAIVNSSGSANYEWTSSALTNGKTYSFSVRAEDQASNEEKNTKTVSTIADDQPPTIIHKPILALLEQEIISVDINATVDDSGGVNLVKLYYRKHGDSRYTDVDMSKEPASVYRSQIPSSILSSVGVDYYISATDKAGNTSTNPVTTISIVRSIQVPIDPSKENEMLLGDGLSVYLPAGA
ncbi:MAG: fibronectin type III domain-containing protein, partial [Candidatus Poribacteria bacterium]